MCAAAWAVVLAWLVGRFATDRFAWSQWLWWIPTPAAIAVAMLGLIGALRPALRPVRRQRRIGIWLVLLITLTAFFGFVENHTLRRDHDPVDGVRILHWNLSYPLPDEYEAYGDALDRLGADITILTSASNVPWRREPNLRPQAFGLFTVLTEFPIVGGRVLALRDTMCLALVEIDTRATLGRTIMLYLVDLPSDPGRPRMAIAQEVRALFRDSGAPPPDLVVGDFNLLRGSASLRRIFPGFRDAFTEAGHGIGATFPRRFPLYHIDHILVAETLRAIDYDLIDPGVGRHRAQAATIVARPD